jgi:ubiquinone biosynthesis accessory factor UbiK
MMEPKSLNEFVKQFSNSLPPVFQDLKSEFEDQFRIGFSYALQKLDLVTRQEFDVQAELLIKLEAKVTELEQKISLLENPIKNNS